MENNKISLSDLVALVAEKASMDQAQVEQFVKTMFDVISEAIVNDDPVKVKDLGTFKLTRMQARESIDVNTGEKIEIPAHDKISFAPATALREIVNKPFSHFESVLISSDDSSFEDLHEFDEGEDMASEDAADDSLHQPVKTDLVERSRKPDKITETILSAVEELEDPEIPLTNVSTDEQEEFILDLPDTTFPQTAEPASRKRSRKSILLIPILGGVAIALASFFFYSTCDRGKSNR